jgi:hypothetical protein
MLTSSETEDIESICDRGFESYLASKHKEHMAEGLESGLIGAFIASIATLGISYFDKTDTVGYHHAWIPAAIGFSGAIAASYLTMKKEDENHQEDFKEVCQKIQE